MFNLLCSLPGRGVALIFQMTIAHDKGKPVARQGRKAVSLLNEVVLAKQEIVWLPKVIGI
jgi:hypothetical protein